MMSSSAATSTSRGPFRVEARYEAFDFYRVESDLDTENKVTALVEAVTRIEDSLTVVSR